MDTTRKSSNPAQKQPHKCDPSPDSSDDPDQCDPAILKSQRSRETLQKNESPGKKSKSKSKKKHPTKYPIKTPTSPLKALSEAVKMGRPIVKIAGSDGRFYCSICSKNYAQSSNLARHLRTHRDKSYPCPNSCGRVFKRIDYIKAHLERCKCRDMTSKPDAKDTMITKPGAGVTVLKPHLGENSAFNELLTASSDLLTISNEKTPSNNHRMDSAQGWEIAESTFDIGPETNDDSWVLEQVPCDLPKENSSSPKTTSVNFATQSIKTHDHPAFKGQSIDVNQNEDSEIANILASFAFNPYVKTNTASETGVASRRQENDKLAVKTTEPVQRKEAETLSSASLEAQKRELDSMKAKVLKVSKKSKVKKTTPVADNLLDTAKILEENPNSDLCEILKILANCAVEATVHKDNQSKKGKAVKRKQHHEVCVSPKKNKSRKLNSQDKSGKKEKSVGKGKTTRPVKKINGINSRSEEVKCPESEKCNNKKQKQTTPEGIQIPVSPLIKSPAKEPKLATNVKENKLKDDLSGQFQSIMVEESIKQEEDISPTENKDKELKENATAKPVDHETLIRNDTLNEASPTEGKILQDGKPPIRFHCKNGRFFCVHCHRDYAQPSGLMRHMEVHGNKTYVCPNECGAILNRAGYAKHYLEQCDKNQSKATPLTTIPHQEEEEEAVPVQEDKVVAANGEQVTPTVSKQEKHPNGVKKINILALESAEGEMKRKYTTFIVSSEQFALIAEKLSNAGKDDKSAEPAKIDFSTLIPLLVKPEQVDANKVIASHVANIPSTSVSKPEDNTHKPGENPPKADRNSLLKLTGNSHKPDDNSLIEENPQNFHSESVNLEPANLETITQEQANQAPSNPSPTAANSSERRSKRKKNNTNPEPKAGKRRRRGKGLNNGKVGRPPVRYPRTDGRYYCRDCQVSYAQSSNLIRHMKTHQEVEYECLVGCGRILKRQDYLKVHMERCAKKHTHLAAKNYAILQKLLPALPVPEAY